MYPNIRTIMHALIGKNGFISCCTKVVISTKHCGHVALIGLNGNKISDTLSNLLDFVNDLLFFLFLSSFLNGRNALIILSSVKLFDDGVRIVFCA